MANILPHLDSRVLIVPNDDVLAKITVQFLVDAFSHILSHKERVYFIPSSGRTPLKTYGLLAKNYADALDWSRISIVQMDEYWSRSLAPQTYFHHFLQKKLVSPLNVGEFVSMRKSNGSQAVELFSPSEYRQKLKEIGPIDFALHGMGRNGHIGFNEPGAHPMSKTRIVTLDRETKDDNFPHLADHEKPQYGISMGLSELKQVKHSLLLASGTAKVSAVQNLLNQTPISENPANVLWDSPDFGVMVDRQASKLVGVI